MCRAQLIVVLACTLGTVDADIQPDWDKLTDFSTKFSLAPDPVILHSGALPRGTRSYHASGEINLDVFGERTYIKTRAILKGHDGDSIHAAGEFYFDGPGRKVALKLQGALASVFGDPPAETITLEPSCAKVVFPQGMLPPPDMIKDGFKQQEPMFEMFLKNEPHTQTTIDGETVQVYTQPQHCDSDGQCFPKDRERFAVRNDATPAAYGFAHPNTEWHPMLKFTDWTKGANIPDDMTCTEMSPDELLAKPYAKDVLRQLDLVMALARRMTPLKMSFTHLPAKPSLLFEGAPDTPSSVQSSVPGMMPTMLLAFAAGTLASLLVFSALKPRRTHGTPLLESVA